MPEGDTIHRAAAALRIALVGKKMIRFEAPRLVGTAPAAGRTIESVEATGKHLEIAFDDGLVLHTHMKMTGSWHLYRPDESWRKPNDQVRALIQSETWTAVCFNAPIVETYRQRDVSRHPRFGGLGPDLCRPDADLNRCVELVMTFDEPDTPIAEVMLDQRIFCGVGNVYRCEVLWITEISPFARVGDLRSSDATRLVNTAATLLRANLRHAQRITVSGVPGGLAVYGRNGQRCSRCFDTVAVRRFGPYQRVLYWCPGCQLRLDPRAELGDVTPPQARRPAAPMPGPDDTAGLDTAGLDRTAALDDTRSGTTGFDDTGFDDTGFDERRPGGDPTPDMSGWDATATLDVSADVTAGMTPDQLRRWRAATQPITRDHPVEQRALDNLPWRRRSG